MKKIDLTQVPLMVLREAGNARRDTSHTIDLGLIAHVPLGYIDCEPCQDDNGLKDRFTWRPGWDNSIVEFSRQDLVDLYKGLARVHHERSRGIKPD